MKAEMRQTLARLPYAEKLRRVAELIEFSRRFKAASPTEREKTVLNEAQASYDANPSEGAPCRDVEARLRKRP